MKQYFVDLHVHIGRAGNGSPVKITASRSLTVGNILAECVRRKGIDVVGIVDASSPAVQMDLRQLVQEGSLRALPDGGMRYKDSVTMIAGAEVETTDRVIDRNGILRSRSAHCLCYFPFLAEMEEFTAQVSRPGRIKNPTLSSQKSNMTMQTLWDLVDSLDGILIPAHAFTPHKGVYGSCVTSIRELLSDRAWNSIPAIELGLSSDSDYADMISELADKTFLSNSDAHSLPKIAREYNLVKMAEPNFKELIMALRREKGREILGNYGFDPKLGKYHRTYCEACSHTVTELPPIVACTECGVKVDGRKVIMGVQDRIYEIRDSFISQKPEHRPPYIHQIPLENIPGIGKRSLDKLLGSYTEMEILHKLDKKQIAEVVGNSLAETILLARAGHLEITSGGGGFYGKVAGKKEKGEIH